MSLCPNCERRVERPAPHAAMTREYYDVLIKALRHVAYRCGYALATHGSLGFDIDLIACPWRDSCIDADSLAEEIRHNESSALPKSGRATRNSLPRSRAEDWRGAFISCMRIAGKRVRTSTLA